MLKLAPIKERHKSILKLSLRFIVSFAIRCNYFAYLFQKVLEPQKKRDRKNSDKEKN